MSDVPDINRDLREDGIDQRLTRFGAGDGRARALLSVIAKGREEVPPSRFDLIDYDTVDVALLPFLVRARSLQEFMFEGIPEDVVRQFLTHAAALHEKKGTVAGTGFALELLGMASSWSQWWEQHPRAEPNTHIVTVYVGRHLFNDEAIFLSAKAQAAALKIIHSTKRWSQDITFRLGAGYQNKVCAGNSLAALGIQHTTFEAQRKRPIRSRLGAGSAFSGLQIMHAQFAT